MPSATQSDQSVSRLGFPLPDSSCDSVDLAIPARRAISASESPVRRRSRTRLLAITLIGCVIKTAPLFYKSNESFGLKNGSDAFIIMEIRSIWLKLYEASSLNPERRHDK